MNDLALVTINVVPQTNDIISVNLMGGPVGTNMHYSVNWGDGTSSSGNSPIFHHKYDYGKTYRIEACVTADLPIESVPGVNCLF